MRAPRAGNLIQQQIRARRFMANANADKLQVEGPYGNAHRNAIYQSLTVGTTENWQWVLWVLEHTTGSVVTPIGAPDFDGQQVLAYLNSFTSGNADLDSSAAGANIYQGDAAWSVVSFDAINEAIGLVGLNGHWHVSLKHDATLT